MAGSNLPDDDKPDIKPDLPGIKDKENNAGSPANGNGFYNPNGDSGGGSAGPLGSSTLSSAEKGAGASAALPGEKLGSGYNPSESRSAASKLKGFIGKRKKTSLAAGGFIGTIIALILGALFLVLPLKVEHIVQNLEHRFFASSQNAVQYESQKLFEQYIVTRVLPGYRSCGTTIDRHCQAIKFGSNPVDNLYRAWSQNRLEAKLAEPPYNIEFQRKPDGWYLKTPTTSEKGVKIGQTENDLDAAFNKVGVGEMRQAIKDQTHWYQVMIRYKVGRLLETKYGIKRCEVYCDSRDPLKDKITAQKTAAKIYLTQRVIEPHNQTLSIAIQCLFQGDDCKATNTTPNADSSAPGENGAPGNPETDVAISQGMRDFAAQFSIVDDASLKAIQDTFNNISDQGFQKYLITSGLTKLGVNEASAGLTADSIPIAGWINMAAQVVTAGSHAGPNLEKLRYLVNGTAAVGIYMMYRSYADEVHTGHDTATEVGSFDTSLGPGNSGGPKDPELGGTADASSTPLYGNIIDGNNSASTQTVASISGSLLSAKAYAASPTPTNSTSTYKCNDGNSVPSGQLVCPEESLGGGSSIANSVSSVINIGGGILPALASAWNSTVGQIFHFVNDVTGSIFQGLASAADASCSATAGILPPGYCPLKSAVTNGISSLVEAVTKWLIPDPFSTNMSGGRTFDEMAAGADVAGNDFAHNGIGGKVLNPTQVASILNQQQAEDQQQFTHEPLFARIFSTDSQYSLVSKVAMDMPFGLQSTAETSFASLISNPFASITHSFGVLFTGKTSAASTPQGDPFGVTQYGYTKSDMDSIGDAQTYWDNNCTDNASQGYQKDNAYNIQANNQTDPNTGMPVNTSVNKCELLKATVGSAGGIYDSSLLTQDDLADVNGSTGSSTGNPSGLVNPFPKGWTPNRLDMGYDGHFDGQIVSPCDGKMVYVNDDSDHSANGGWEGAFIAVQCSQQIAALPSSVFYFAEGIQPTVTQDQSVNAGQQIATPGWTGYSEGPGGIEWGLADPQNPDTVTLAESGINGMTVCSAASKTMVLNFADWVHQNLGVSPPSATNDAGCT